MLPTSYFWVARPIYRADHSQKICGGLSSSYYSDRSFERFFGFGNIIEYKDPAADSTEPNAFGAVELAVLTDRGYLVELTEDQAKDYGAARRWSFGVGFVLTLLVPAIVLFLQSPFVREKLEIKFTLSMALFTMASVFLGILFFHRGATWKWVWDTRPAIPVLKTQEHLLERAAE